MPNRDQWRGFGGGESGPRDRDGAGRSGRGSEDRSFGAAARDPLRDPVFRAEDARLNAALERQERVRGVRRPEYGHDQNYRPGYHEGGSRFGFFGFGREDRDIDQDFDPDYLHWRAQQMARHDHDYADWRRHQREQYDEEYRRFRAERRDDFHQRFQDWRAQRDAAASAAATPPEDKI
jgi:hypothetical protein